MTSHFSDSHPNLQIAWDSMSMQTFLECPRKYQLQYLQHWVSRGKKIELEFGILMHSAMERFWTELAQGAPQPDAIRSTCSFILEAGRELPDDPKELRSTYTLIRAFIWYVDKFGGKDDFLQTYILPNGKAATELSFRIALPLISPDGEPYLYCGHIDRVATFDGAPVATDYKTTGSALGDYWSKQFDLSWQITGYAFAAATEVPEASTKVVIDGIQLAQGFSRFKRVISERHDDQIQEWLQDFVKWIRQAERYAEEGYWPMNLSSCTKYGGCAFLEVCRRGQATRNNILEADYVQRIWNPLDSR